jgi:hypothetical protein
MNLGGQVKQFARDSPSSVLLLGSGTWKIAVVDATALRRKHNYGIGTKLVEGAFRVQNL